MPTKCDSGEKDNDIDLGEGIDGKGRGRAWGDREMGGKGRVMGRAVLQQISGNQKVNRHPVLENRSTYWMSIAK